MAPKKSSDQSKTKTGFAGLSSMVSNLNNIQSPPPSPPAPKRFQPALNDPARPEPTISPIEFVQPLESPLDRVKSAVEKGWQSLFEFAGERWNGLRELLGILFSFMLMGFILFCVSNIFKNSQQITGSATNKPTSAVAPSVRPLEEKPPAGQNLLLSSAQISYCLAEKIRLDAASQLVDDYNNEQVKRYNAKVNDYNSSCAKFKYRNNNLAKARNDLAPFEKEIRAEGRAWFSSGQRYSLSGPPIAASSFTASPTAVTPLPPTEDELPLAPGGDEVVRQIQAILYKLGYQPGPANGLYTSQTFSAIIAFEKDRKLNLSGEANFNLLRQLAQARGQIEGSARPSPTPLPVETMIARPGASDSLIHSIQTGLTALGYKPGMVDGLLGPNTVKAIKQFQDDFGFPVTGDISPELLLQILEASS